MRPEQIRRLGLHAANERKGPVFPRTQDSFSGGGGNFFPEGSTLGIFNENCTPVPEPRLRSYELELIGGGVSPAYALAPVRQFRRGTSLT